MAPDSSTQNDDLHHAAALMQQALDMLDRAGETRAATHLQHAFDTLQLRLATDPPQR